jgi:DNA-binding NarL/FixJ family response regulator
MEPITLLLVDDHDIVRTGLRSFLDSQSGFSVVAEARNGTEALQRALETQPAIVLMDISMPGMDGATCASLKQSCRTPRFWRCRRRQAMCRCWLQARRLPYKLAPG